MIPLGGHGDFRLSVQHTTECCGGNPTFLSRTCDGVPEVLKATREELRGGADFIKIMCGGGVASPTVSSPKLTIKTRLTRDQYL